MSVKTLAILFFTAWSVLAFTPAMAQDEAETVGKAEKLAKDAQAALASFYEKVPDAKILGEKAQAILVFPKITKAGLGIGGQRGSGTLLKDDKPVAFYNTTGASYGLQAGAQTYGYALFLMNDTAMQSLNKAGGFEVGLGPSVVVVNKGTAKNLTTTTLKADIYAVVFDQKGIMGGVGIQGNKITKTNPK